MDTTREPKWMCWRCGYSMDAASTMSGRHHAPREDDLSMCLNCGALYARHSDTWKPATSIELATLDDATREQLAKAQAARQRVVQDDLVKRIGNA